MNTQRHQETTPHHDLELKDACAGCGGVLAVRIAPGSGRGVCLACHLLTPMTVVRSGDGLMIAQAPLAVA